MKSAKEIVEIMQAYLDDEVVQIFMEGGNVPDVWDDLGPFGHDWDWVNEEYRIKPDVVPPTLKQRIEDQFKDCEVVILESTNLGTNTDCISSLIINYKGCTNVYHTQAQSMKGFAGYVYTSAVGFVTNLTPTIWARLSTEVEFPIAVLFLV